MACRPLLVSSLLLAGCFEESADVNPDDSGASTGAATSTAASDTAVDTNDDTGPEPGSTSDAASSGADSESSGDAVDSGDTGDTSDTGATCPSVDELPAMLPIGTAVMPPVADPEDNYEPGCGANGLDYAWRYVAPVDGPIRFSTAGSTADTILSVFADDCSTELACSDNLPTVPTTIDVDVYETSKVDVVLTAGEEVFVVVDGLAPGEEVELRYRPPVPKIGNCCDANGGVPGCMPNVLAECVCNYDVGCCMPTPGWDQLCVDVAEYACFASC